MCAEDLASCMQVSQRKAPDSLEEFHEEVCASVGGIDEMLSLRGEVAAQRVRVESIRAERGVSEELVSALDVLAALQDKLVSLTLRPAMQQASLEEVTYSMLPSDQEARDQEGGFFKKKSGKSSFTRRRRGAVSSESAPEVLATAHIPRIVVPKSDMQRSQLQNALQDLVLFSDVHPEDLNAIVDAFTHEHCAAGTMIMKQGEVGDKFYIVVSGTCDVYVEDDPSHSSPRRMVATVSDGKGFGELALLYNSPRAATVISRTPCALWSLDRATFSAVLLRATAQRRAQYVGFLGCVPILLNMTPAEKAKIADVMEAKWFEDSEYIIEQGEVFSTVP